MGWNGGWFRIHPQFKQNYGLHNGTRTLCGRDANPSPRPQAHNPIAACKYGINTKYIWMLMQIYRDTFQIGALQRWEHNGTVSGENSWASIFPPSKARTQKIKYYDKQWIEEKCQINSPSEKNYHGEPGAEECLGAGPGREDEAPAGKRLDALRIRTFLAFALFRKKTQNKNQEKMIQGVIKNFYIRFDKFPIVPVGSNKSTVQVTCLSRGERSMHFSQIRIIWLSRWNARWKRSPQCTPSSSTSDPRTPRGARGVGRTVALWGNNFGAVWLQNNTHSQNV